VTEQYDVAAIMGGLYGDGIIGLKGAFSREFADTLNADMMSLFEEARQIPGGALPRGPERWYVETQPERIRGFVEIATHPWFVAVCEAVLTKDYRIVEIGFDIPFPGAKNQPWHRDFRTPPETAEEGRLTSLAFNLTTVDVTPELAPFEIAPGTQFDDGSAFDHGMFPGPDASRRYDELGSKRYPRRGDASARTGLTVHRGTENLSDGSRAVLILGAVTGDTDPADIEVHDLVVTRAYHEALPEDVRRHLLCRVVDELAPIEQKHDIEGLMMGG
jgi:hypothetical protein